MSDLVVVSGDFSSGTTALFTVFRQTGDYYCLYEPLHQKLLEYLVYPLRPDEHHDFVKPYFREYRGFRAIPDLFKPEWGVSKLYLDPGEAAPEFHRYWAYLIGTAYARSPRVMLKENRLAFRLGWLKANFPRMKVVHVSRAKEKQWASIVRRGQEFLGREDIGQDSVHFSGFNVAQWCEVLADRYPELAAQRSSSGFERFSKLWDLCDAEQRRFADISIDHKELVEDFPATAARIGAAIGYEFDIPRLAPYIRAPDSRATGHRSTRDRLVASIDDLGRRYAKGRVAFRYWRRGDLVGARATIAGTPGGLPRERVG
jgi:hypothetical protein